jgi:hypothetical protein
VLAPGRYPARVAIVGPEGWRWQRSVEIAVQPGRGPLALAVLDEQVTLDGAPGQYRCAASLGTAAAPASGRCTVDVIERPAPLTRRQRAGALGLRDGELDWLSEHGLDIGSDGEGLKKFGLLLVGHAAELDENKWRTVSSAVDRGATAIVLNPWELIAPGDTSVTLPFATQISCTSFRDWLHRARPRGGFGRARPNGMASLRSRPATALIARRRRRSGSLRRCHRVPLSGRVRIGHARSQLPPGGRPGRREYFRPVGEPRLARGRRPTNSQPVAVCEPVTPSPVVLTGALSAVPLGRSLQATGIVYSRHSTTQQRAFGQPGGGPQVMIGRAYKRGLT